MGRVVWLVVLSAAATGCSLDLTGLEGGDSGAAPRRDGSPYAIPGAPDAAPSDAAPPDAAPPDAAPSDATVPPRLDAGAGDAGPPDAGAPDAGPPFCDPGDSTLVLCLPCEGSPADGSAQAHLVVSSASTQPGHVGAACRCEASTSFVVADAPSLDFGPLTAELFVRIDSLPTSGRRGLIDKNGSFGFFVYAGGALRCSAGGTVSASAAIVAGRWTHVACTAGDGQTRIYVDGARVAEISAPVPTPSGSPLQVGEDSPSGGDQLLGLVDELRVYARVRTDAEIRAAAAR